MNKFGWYEAKVAVMVKGREWSSNGRVAMRDYPIWDSLRQIASAPQLDAILDGAEPSPVESIERVNGYAIVNGAFVFAAHFLSIAEDTSPGLSWHRSCDALVGIVNGEPVALVMGMRLTPLDARAGEDKGYPKCHACKGDGHAADCEACGGSGEDECEHCGREGECGECRGDGRIGTCSVCGGDGYWKDAA